MQKLVESDIEFDEKVVAGEKLPETMIVYVMDAEHFILTAKPIEHLEEDALTKMSAKVVSQQNKYIVKLPQKIYNFYHLDENNYTIMASDRDPTTIIITRGREELIGLPEILVKTMEPVASALIGINEKFAQVVDKFGVFGGYARGIDEKLDALPERIAEAMGTAKKKPQP